MALEDVEHGGVEGASLEVPEEERYLRFADDLLDWLARGDARDGGQTA